MKKITLASVFLSASSAFALWGGIDVDQISAKIHDSSKNKLIAIGQNFVTDATGVSITLDKSYSVIGLANELCDLNKISPLANQFGELIKIVCVAK